MTIKVSDLIQITKDINLTKEKMRRDDMEKAATQHANMIGWDHDPEETRGLFAYSFEKGAEWRINSVWHNAITDIPEAYFPVLVEDDLEDFEVSMLALVEECPKNWRRWAYIEDLLPNTEE